MFQTVTHLLKKKKSPARKNYKAVFVALGLVNNRESLYPQMEKTWNGDG